MKRTPRRACSKMSCARGGSLLIRLAEELAVPAGGALAVDRERFSAAVTERLAAHPNIELRREEAQAINPAEITVHCRRAARFTRALGRYRAARGPLMAFIFMMRSRPWWTLKRSITTSLFAPRVTARAAMITSTAR